MSITEFARRCTLVLLLVTLALLAYALAHVLLLIFGAALIAVMLRAIAAPIRRWTRLPDRVAVMLALVVLVTLVGMTLTLFGTSITQDFAALQSQLTAGWASLQAKLDESVFGRQLLEWLREATPSARDVASRFGSFVGTLGSAIANLIIALFAGVYLALAPTMYVEGIALLVPRERHDQVIGALRNAGRALRLWLVGQLVAMLLVGVLTGIGLWIVGVPSALALGLIAGLTEFVPLVGPIAAAVPGLLIALTVSPETVLYALLVYLLVQQTEGNLITPLVVRRTVAIPPALTLLGVLAAGVLFGPVGVLLAAPLVVVAFVLVKRLYVRETLGHTVEIPGE